MENNRSEKQIEEGFENELDELIEGIAKIKSTRKLFSGGSSNSTKSENDKNNFNSPDQQTVLPREIKRIPYRPEAALWLSLAAYISSLSIQDTKIRSYANLLGGHLSRRRARNFASRFRRLEDVTMSPRVRNLVVSLCEKGAKVDEVFGVWIKLAIDMEVERINSYANCLQPAISILEKNGKNLVLIPRFPERMPIELCHHQRYGKVAKVSEEGKLVFIFWMDDGIEIEDKICGIAWMEAGVFPILSN